jgi:hypothetical protein
MASNVITRQQWGPPAVGTRDGNWVWDGSNWVCNPDCGTDGQPCPPMGPPVFSGPVNQPPWYPGANGGVSFGAVAPPNPVRGHMWWDGTTFWLFDGAAWVAISGTETLVKGVVDGSNAPPGYVGEFISAQVNVPFAANPAVTSVTVPTITLTAGDWDVWCGMEITTAVGAIYMYLNPQPPGVNTNMAAVLGVSFSGVAATEGLYPLCIPGRALLTTPTLLSWYVRIDQSLTAGLAAGTGYLIVGARRRR